MKLLLTLKFVWLVVSTSQYTLPLLLEFSSLPSIIWTSVRLDPIISSKSKVGGCSCLPPIHIWVFLADSPDNRVFEWCPFIGISSVSHSLLWVDNWASKFKWASGYSGFKKYPSVLDFLLLWKSQKGQELVTGLVFSHYWQLTEVLMRW